MHLGILTFSGADLAGAIQRAELLGCVVAQARRVGDGCEVDVCCDQAAGNRVALAHLDGLCIFLPARTLAMVGT